MNTCMCELNTFNCIKEVSKLFVLMYDQSSQNFMYSSLFSFCCLVPTHNVTANCGEALRRRAMTCSCTADGDPVPTSFVWRAPNGTVLHSGSSYSTPRVEQSLNGSYYTCAASNGFSVDSRNTSLFNVLGKC